MGAEGGCGAVYVGNADGMLAKAKKWVEASSVLGANFLIRSRNLENVRIRCQRFQIVILVEVSRKLRDSNLESQQQLGVFSGKLRQKFVYIPLPVTTSSTSEPRTVACAVLLFASPHRERRPSDSRRRSALHALLLQGVGAMRSQHHRIERCASGVARRWVWENHCWLTISLTTRAHDGSGSDGPTCTTQRPHAGVHPLGASATHMAQGEDEEKERASRQSTASSRGRR